MGHLARSVKLAAALGGGVSFLTTRMDSAARAFLAEELLRFPRRPRPSVLDRLPAQGRWDILLVDERRTSREELARLARHGMVVCLDEGGEARRYAPFVVDALPRLPGISPANLSSPAFLDLPPRRKRRPRIPPRRVLLSFGGEDREGLTGRLVGALLDGEVFAAEDITVVKGPLFAAREWPEGVETSTGAAGLAGGLAECDLLFCHFGMTALEGLSTGVPVITFNPSAYHTRLSLAAGIPTIGTISPDLGALRRLLGNPADLRGAVDRLNREIGTGRGVRLPSLLAGLTSRGAASCPLCGSEANPVVARFPERSYRRCARCGITHLQSFAPQPKRYGRDYFSKEYRAQYGRTYLEDFESIRNACRPRAKIVQELLRVDGEGVVVDVGCAYGPFLDAAREAGMAVFGVDVSPGVVAHVRSRLRIPAVCDAFETMAPRSLPRRTAAITMWYVIEHFTDPDLVLRKVASLLPAGGVFAFSTPNGRGISGLRSFHEFLSNSPADHFTIFSPRGLRRLLEGYGLDLRRIRVTGHHPERFPGLAGAAARRFPPARRVLLGISRLFGLGDTFEAYAVKGK
jgi:2-polyprenyl-3-methyl-5-hydroxy-6-metoxy-1,4-benzoquinol methylase